MKRLLIAAGLALAATAVHAQEAPAPAAPATSQQEAEARASVSVSGHTDKVYHGPHRYPMKERGKHAGDPPIIDHSADTLLVEPTHSSITVTIPTPP